MRDFFDAFPEGGTTFQTVIFVMVTASKRPPRRGDSLSGRYSSSSS